MKNFLFLFTISILTITNSFAQNKGYLALSAGPSIPIGEFASKDPNNTKAGCATTGVSLNLSFAYKLGKKLGLAALLRSQSNSFDNEAFENELETQTGASWTIDSKPYTTRGFMLGGYGAFPISETVSFNTRALFGFLSTNSYELTSSIDNSGGAAWFKISSVSATSFAYLLGGGFKFDVSENVCMLINIDYLQTKPEFRNIQITSSNGGPPSKATASQEMSTINIELGIGIRL